jgi:pimeloyl-ACP methyl ester carboxylesterase
MTKGMSKHQLIQYTVSGDGPPVVLLHGLASSRSDWVWLAPELNKAGYRVYMPDLMGHGESVKPQDSALYSVRTLYALFEDWLESLPESGPMVFIGHSLGGHLAMLLARRRPQIVRSLVLIDPFFSQNQLSPGIRLLNSRPDIGERSLRHAPPWLVNSLIGLDPWTTNKFPSDIRSQIATDYLRASPHILYIPRTAADLSKMAKDLHQPTMVIWGERDITLSARSFAPLVRQMPQSTGKSVTNCGHQPHLSRPDLVNPWIIEYLACMQ